MTLADGRTFYPGQGNNAYVFPGVALGVIACGVRHISDDVFLTTAEVRSTITVYIAYLDEDFIWKTRFLDAFIFTFSAVMSLSLDHT